MNSYAASQPTERESRRAPVEPGRQITPVETPLPEPATDHEVQNVLEEEVAFAPGPVEEAIVADLSDVSDLPESDQNALSSEDRSRPKVVSSVLNFIASNIQIGSGGT